MMTILITFILTTLATVLFLLCNFKVYKDNAYVARYINTNVPRNIDRLIIGDYCDVSFFEKSNIIVTKLSPSKQSDQSIVLLSKRLYSLLDEHNGILTVVQKKGQRKHEGISVFDIPYLHENTIADLGLGGLRKLSKLPFLFDFINSLKIFLKIERKVKLEKKECPIQELVIFCKSRNINLEYYEAV